MAKKAADKKTKVYGTAGVLLTLIIFAVSQVGGVDANFVPGTFEYGDLYSPLVAPYIYQNSTLDICFDHGVPNNWTQINSFSYSLDGKRALSFLPSDSFTPHYYFHNYSVYSFHKTLENLTDGNHPLRIYAYYANGTVRKISDITFTVNSTFSPPIITALSPLNQTVYHTDKIQLTYNINSKVIWAYYTLDSQTDNWIPLSGNGTLTSLSEGTHTVTIAVRSESNQHTQDSITKQTVCFTVDVAKSEAPSVGEFPAAVLVIAFTVVTITVAGMSFYRRIKVKD